MRRSLAAAVATMRAIAAGSPAHATAAAPLAWPAPVLVDKHGPFAATTEVRGMSCPSTSLCVGAGPGGKLVTSVDPTDGATATWTVAGVCRRGAAGVCRRGAAGVRPPGGQRRYSGVRLHHTCRAPRETVVPNPAADRARLAEREMALTVRCDQAAKLALTGKVTAAWRSAPGGRLHRSTFRLGPVGARVHAGVPLSLRVRRGRPALAEGEAAAGGASIGSSLLLGVRNHRDQRERIAHHQRADRPAAHSGHQASAGPVSVCAGRSAASERALARRTPRR